MFRSFCVIVLLTVLAGCAPESPADPPTTSTTAAVTTPPTTSSPGTVTVRPSGGDDTPALVAAIATNPIVVIDRPLRIDNVVLITASNRTVTFTGTGVLVRTLLINPARPTDTRTFQAILIRGASNVTINNVQVSGPGGICDVPRTTPPLPGQSPTYQAIYDATTEAQHAIEINATANVTINGGYVHDMRGDGVYLTNGARTTRINDLHTKCTGRSSVSNVGSIDTIIRGGFYERSGLWAYNVEPYGSQLVDRYLIDRPKVGVTNWQLLFVGGTCNVTGVVLDRPDVTLRNGTNTTRGCGTPTGVPSFTYIPA